MGDAVDSALQTDRLILREWRDADLEPFVTLNSDPEVARYLRGRPMTIEETAASFASIREHWGVHGFGRFVAELRETGEFIGFIGMGYLPHWPELAAIPEIGWRLSPAHWNRGLATEGARAVLADAFARRGFARVISTTLPENRASVRVMEKIGMRFDREVLHPRLGRTIHVYVGHR
jgi:RimJ/RimL family protein N-acetyltransferase